MYFVVVDCWADNNVEKHGTILETGPVQSCILLYFQQERNWFNQLVIINTNLNNKKSVLRVN